MIRKSLLLIFAATLIILPLMTVTASAHPDKPTCTECHSLDSSVKVNVNFLDCSSGNIANYSVSVSDTYDAGEGWAVFDSSNNIDNANGISGNFSVVAGHSYDVYGVSDSDLGIGGGKGGTDVVVINPDCGSPCTGGPEICDDGTDNDCDGLTDAEDSDCSDPPCTDADGDTYAMEGDTCGPIDCNDDDPGIHPGAPEDCTDGKDNNCNGQIDAQDPKAFNCPLPCTDADDDTYAIEGGICGPIDCDDTYALSNPGEFENCEDGYDNDCDNLIDGDDTDCGGCVKTGREKGKKCSDGIDNDCNGLTDNEDPDCSTHRSEGKGKTCRDGLDNDGDSYTDCADSGCALSRYCIETIKVRF